MKKNQYLIAAGKVLVVIMVTFFVSCSKSGNPTPVPPPAPKDAKIVGDWHISQYAEHLDPATNGWVKDTLSDKYTSTIFHIGAGVDHGNYTAEKSTNNFNTSDGVWTIVSGTVTLKRSPSTDPDFSGPISYGADGSFTIETMRVGTLVHLTWVKN